MSVATLVPSTTQAGAGTATPTFTNIAHPERVKLAIFFLNITAASAVAGDTFNAYIQHSPDGGTTWDDFVSFTQALGNGGAKKFLAYWSRDAAPTTPTKTAQDGTLAAGSVQNGAIASQWRAKVISVGTGSFTYSVQMDPVFERPQ